MADLALVFGGDLTVSATGDLALADGPALTVQRVLRRLLTNGGDYIWQLTYGAGLGQFVGQPGAPGVIAGVALAQMKLEATVAATPAPVVSATQSSSGDVTLNIQYADATTGETSQLTFTI